MTKNRNASSTLFGFQFQVNSAIVLMLENIKNLKEIRLEGDKEDIEIYLNDNNVILAQAKSIVNGSYDFQNVRSKLEKSLISLSEGSKNIKNVKELIMITNSANPLKLKNYGTIFHPGMETRKKFKDLSPDGKNVIEKIINKKNVDIDLSKFKIQILPFETDDEKEKYKFIKKNIEEFLYDIKITQVIAIDLMGKWQNELLENGSKKDGKINLTKKQIMWPMIVILLDIEKNKSEFLEDLDTELYEEVVSRYAGIIDTCNEQFEFSTKIIYDFNGFSKGKNLKENQIKFINRNWKNYAYCIEGAEIEEEHIEPLIKIIIDIIINNRKKIDKIKQGVNL